MTDAIVIVSAARTPMGSFQSDFASLAAHDLGGAAIRAAVERAGIQPEQVEEVIFGNCLMAGQGQAPARQAGFKGGLPKSAGAVTLSKMCGSGMRAAMFAHDMLLAGSARGGGGRRHGEHDQRALPAAEGPRRLPHRPRPHLRPHDARRPGRRLRARPLHGHLRRGLRRQIQLHPRRAGRLCHRQRAARQGRHRDRRLCRRDHARHGQGPRRRDGDLHRRRPGQGQARQDPDAQTRFQERRHHHRGLQQLASTTAPLPWC